MINFLPGSDLAPNIATYQCPWTFRYRWFHQEATAPILLSWPWTITHEYHFSLSSFRRNKLWVGKKRWKKDQHQAFPSSRFNYILARFSDWVGEFEIRSYRMRIKGSPWLPRWLCILSVSEGFTYTETSELRRSLRFERVRGWWMFSNYPLAGQAIGFFVYTIACIARRTRNTLLVQVKLFSWRSLYPTQLHIPVRGNTIDRAGALALAKLQWPSTLFSIQTSGIIRLWLICETHICISQPHKSISLYGTGYTTRHMSMHNSYEFTSHVRTLKSTRWFVRLWHVEYNTTLWNR